MKNNKDFLRQFFKEQNIFQQDNKTSPNPKNTPTPIDTTKFISNKHINLKALFQTIEDEKQKIQQIQTTIIEEKAEVQKEEKKQEKTERFIERLIERKIENKKIRIKTKAFKTQFKKQKPTQTKIYKKQKIQTVKPISTKFVKKTSKTEEKTKQTQTIEDLASFNQIIQNNKKTIKLENILESQNRGTGKNRLSRLKERPSFQRIFLPDLWEKSPERYSKHDEILEIDNFLEEKKDHFKTQKLKNTQQYFEKNKKRQEMKRGIIKEFNSYASFVSNYTAKTHDFFQNYLKSSKNLISEKYKNYKKQRIINAITAEREKKERLIFEKQKKTEIKRITKIKEIKNEQNSFITETKEWIKIFGLVAGIFIIGTFTLRAPGFISQYENILNPISFSTQQDSVSNLLEKTENPFKNIESLPVAGIKDTSQKLDINQFLTITPPDRRIIIPKIAKNIPILEVDPINLENGKFSDFEADVQKMLKDGVVHYPGTAEPGQNGNVFITGHSSYYPWDNGKYKDVFAALHNLEEGDEYFVFDKGKKYKYIITTRKVVPPSDVSVLDQDYTKKTSTLMTCTPVGTAKNRLILQSELVEVGY